MKAFVVLITLLTIGCVTLHAQESTTFTLTRNGIGCIEMGMDAGDIPAVCEGLYNKVEEEIVESDDEEEFETSPSYRLYRFYQGKVKVMEISITAEDDNAVHYITVFSPHIQTENGLYPGILVEELTRLSDVEWQIEGEYYGAVIEGYIAIELKNKYLTASGLNKYEDVFVNGKEAKFFPEDIKPHSRIEEISIYDE